MGIDKSIKGWPNDGLEYLRRCPICASTKSKLLYEGLFDRLFGAPGIWRMYLCNECQSGYLNPRPNEQTIALAYENYVTHEIPSSAELTDFYGLKRLRVEMRNGYLNRKYGYRLEPSVFWGFLAMYLMPSPLRLEWDHYARHLPRPRSGANCLLDVGCGNGEFLLQARKLGWKVQGLDFDPGAAAAARSRGLDVWSGGYSQAPFEPGSFDQITSHQVIEHVHDSGGFIRTLASWLKLGGRLWIGTPNFSSTTRKIFGPNWRHLHPPQHLSVLSSNALLDLFRNSGLEPRLYPRGFFETHVVAESETLRQGAVSLREIEQRKQGSSRKFLSLTLEINSWIRSRTASDMVVVGVKGH